MKRRRVANLLALAVLSLLRPGYPMHPYQIANVLRRTGKDRDMPIKVGSLYTVVRNLERHGLIEATGSHRAGRRPERTEYAITDAGRAELRDWLRELVAVPEPEYPRFQAALSVLSTVAEAPAGPALLFARRHAIAAYASVLLSADRPDEALEWARRAQTTPGEDVRSRVYAARTLASALAATGQAEEARVIAAAAAHEAYSTQQVSERAAVDEVRERINRLAV